MLALYLATFGFGATMILVSLILGGAGDKDLHADHDAQLDADADQDAAADADHDADGADGSADHEAPSHDGPNAGDAWWLPLLSLRFWTFGAASFGLAGTLLTFLSVPGPLALVVAVLLGLGSGVAAARLFSALRTDQVSGETDLGRYVGEEARVVVPVRPGAQGKIVVATMAGRIEILATTRDPGELGVGTRVLVAGVDRDGVADVSRIDPELEARHRAVQSAEAAVRSASKQGRSVGS